MIKNKITKLGELEIKKIELAKQCGLTFSGLNGDAELEFIGTDEQWSKFDEENK